MVGRDPVAAVGALVVVVLVATGPLTGLDVTGAEATTFGEGDATIDGVELDASALVVTDGRFGAAGPYLRPPTAAVTVSSVSDRPRLVYVVAVPALGVDRTETAVVTSPGTYRLAPDDRALAPGTATGSYDATLTVRLQSFETDRTLVRANTTVEVGA
jgi:hypothetical protein